MTKNRLLVVDGSNLLFQMFFGMPSRIVNAQGKAIQGVLGFVGALLKIIRSIKPSHIVVIFDGEHENARTALDSEYKANRICYNEIPEEDNPFSQIDGVYAALDFIGIKHMETVTCEADDIIAGYALSYGMEMEVVISSFDSDFFQLITNHVSVLRYRGKNTTIHTVESIMEKFGIEPYQYADYKSLTGDASDNIKGADKVGAKTAALLLKEFGSLENIIVQAEKIKKDSVRESIIRNKEKLKTNYEIIKLGNTNSLPFELNALVYAHSEITTNDVLKGIGLK